MVEKGAKPRAAAKRCVQRGRLCTPPMYQPSPARLNWGSPGRDAAPRLPTACGRAVQRRTPAPNQHCANPHLRAELGQPRARRRRPPPQPRLRRQHAQHRQRPQGLAEGVGRAGHQARLQRVQQGLQQHGRGQAQVRKRLRGAGGIEGGDGRARGSSMCSRDLIRGQEGGQEARGGANHSFATIPGSKPVRELPQPARALTARFGGTHQPPPGGTC